MRRISRLGEELSASQEGLWCEKMARERHILWISLSWFRIGIAVGLLWTQRCIVLVETEFIKYELLLKGRPCTMKFIIITQLLGQIVNYLISPLPASHIASCSEWVERWRTVFQERCNLEIGCARVGLFTRKLRHHNVYYETHICKQIFVEMCAAEIGKCAAEIFVVSFVVLH